MKKVVVIIMVIMLGFSAQAQEDAVSRFFTKYADDESFSNVNITARMFGLFTDLELEDKEDQEVMNAISKLKGLKILAKDHVVNGKDLYREALGLLPKKEFDELMSVRDEDKDMKFMIKEKNGKIEELVMIMGGNREFFILTLFGEIDLKQVARISKAMDIDGLEGLENIKGN
ncbi:MAG: DUF4252 domain-containing protein [Bacteroidota bacterium]